MEMHQLRYAVAVARTGNFSRAAEQCHVAQPSLSQQIQKLEEELGERVFERRQREARPTPFGEAFLRRATRILEEAEAARREAAEAQGLLRGTITVGVLPTIAPYLLPLVLARFAKRFPGLEVVVQEDTTARLLKLAHAWEIDFAVASEPVRDVNLEIRPLFTEELLVALPPGHALARKSVLLARDLAGERLIVMQDGHCLGDQVLGFCTQRRVRARVSFRSAQLETIRALVRAGLGVSLIPAMATQADQQPGGPVYRPLAGRRPQRRLVAFWPHGRPPGRGALELLQLMARPPAPERNS
jgi:LysR family hydrogen peroxide-inducible transcriptional activator